MRALRPLQAVLGAAGTAQIGRPHYHEHNPGCQEYGVPRRLTECHKEEDQTDEHRQRTKKES